jgi:hypothetical protein
MRTKHQRPLAARRVGWHFTSLERARSIIETGLRTYDLRKPEVTVETGLTRGSFVFTDLPATPTEWVGQIVFTATNQGSFDVGLVRVTYSDVIVARHRLGGALGYLHTGHFIGRTGEITTDYHRDKPIVVLTDDVPATQCSLEGSWDLLSLLTSTT